MNCICGCGTRLRRDQLEVNLLAGELAVELVVWDKARAAGAAAAAMEVEALIAAGAPAYQRLLRRLHAGEEPGGAELEGAREWLERSRAMRLRLADELAAVPKRKVKLSRAEQERIDRRRPERTFSGGAAAGDRPLEALLLSALEDVRGGRPEEAERALRRFLSERS